MLRTSVRTSVTPAVQSAPPTEKSIKQRCTLLEPNRPSRAAARPPNPRVLAGVEHQLLRLRKLRANTRRPEESKRRAEDGARARIGPEDGIRVALLEQRDAARVQGDVLRAIVQRRRDAQQLELGERVFDHRLHLERARRERTDGGSDRSRRSAAGGRPQCPRNWRRGPRRQ